MYVIRHEAVRNHRKRLLLRRAPKLLGDELDVPRVDEVPPSLMRAHGE
jgi:hypothetical protein